MVVVKTSNLLRLRQVFAELLRKGRYQHHHYHVTRLYTVPQIGAHKIADVSSSFFVPNNYLAIMDSEKIVAVILALFLPPLAVFMKCGLSTPFWINIVCCIFFWFPAILHALYVVLAT